MPHWDVASLFPDPDSAVVDALLSEPLREAQKMAADYAGALSGLDAPSLRTAIRRYEHCVARIQEASCYGELLQTDTALRPRALALLSRCDRAWAELASTLAFFETGLGALPEAPDGLGPYANFLGKVRAASAGNLPDVQESILARLLPTGGEGWERLSQQLLRDLSVKLDGGAPRSVAEALPGLYEADRDARKATHAAIGAALADRAGLRAFALSMTVADSETRAAIRGTDWLRERRLFDQVSRAEVDGLLTADC
ncbi:hypothetical protein [Streptomyces sp. NPDC059398]|uniref:hypothetical protein n=1 Tax=Streptomyces sp. NPDC059398 TaxID=3346820 RepID=UPI0036CC0C0B